MKSWIVAMAVLPGSVLLAGGRASAQDVPAASTAAGTQTVVEGRSVRVTSGASATVVDLGCDGRASLRADRSLFVMCVPGGVVEIDLSNPLAPRVAGRMLVDGEATALFLRDGRAWVEVSHVDARPVRAEVSAVPVPAVAGSPPQVSVPVVAVASPAEVPAAMHVLMAPPRHGGLWELSAMAGAFVNLGPLAGGATGWASAVYRFDAPIVVRAELAPLGVAFGQNVGTTTGGVNGTGTGPPTGAAALGAAHLLVGLDTQFVEVAVGGGGASISNSGDASGPPAAAGASIVEEGRFGARDGLALNVESITVAANNQFKFGSFVASIQVPVTPTVMLLIRGGGGSVGVLFGDLGARVFIRGDGGPDTIALTGYFGGAGVDFESCYSTTLTSACSNYTSVGGPSIGGGVEWRH